jgi:hypothetical protein
MIFIADRQDDVRLVHLHLGTSRSHHGPPGPRKSLNVDEKRLVCSMDFGDCFLIVLYWGGNQLKLESRRVECSSSVGQVILLTQICFLQPSLTASEQQ